MKCHKYQLMVCEGTMDFIHRFQSPQKRLYIPNKGIIGYGFHEEDKIDCFLDDKESIEQGEKAIAGTLKDSRYLGKIELPEDKINEFIKSYKTKEQAEEDFQKKGKTLISLLK